MVITLERQDFENIREGEPVKTTFFGVRKIWVVPGEKIISLLLQSGWVYEHELSKNWQFSCEPEESDEQFAVSTDGEIRGYFRS